MYAWIRTGYLPWSTKPYLTLGSLRVTDKVVVHLAVLMVGDPSIEELCSLLGDDVLLGTSISSTNDTANDWSPCSQLAMQHSWNSLMPAACGILVAVLYRSRIFHLQRFRVPGKQMFAVRASHRIGPQFDAWRDMLTRITTRQHSPAPCTAMLADIGRSFSVWQSDCRTTDANGKPTAAE